MRRFLLLTLALLSACFNEEPLAPDTSLATPVTDWRLQISLPGAELPVQLQMAQDGSNAWLINGQERIRVPQVQREGKLWKLQFPAFNNSLVFEQTGNSLRGLQAGIFTDSGRTAGGNQGGQRLIGISLFWALAPVGGTVASLLPDQLNRLGCVC